LQAAVEAPGLFINSLGRTSIPGGLCGGLVGADEPISELNSTRCTLRSGLAALPSLEEVGGLGAVSLDRFNSLGHPRDPNADANAYQNGYDVTRATSIGLSIVSTWALIPEFGVGLTELVGSELGANTLEDVSVQGTCSFSSDTQVATDNGETPIDELKVGDKVLAYDQQTKTTGSYVIKAVLTHSDSVIVYLTLNGETLETTPEHPFYTQERGWVPAGDLRVGEHVRKAVGTFGTVQKVRREQHQQTMYNLTVDHAHTFFVGNGQWLVHNECKYSVVYEAELKAGVDYPKRISSNLPLKVRRNLEIQLRQIHNRVANSQLYDALEADPAFKSWVSSSYPEIVSGVQPLSNGSFPRVSPNGWNWHHVVDRGLFNMEGRMQLITKADHKAFEVQIHLPGRVGGLEQWGIIR